VHRLVSEVGMKLEASDHPSGFGSEESRNVPCGVRVAALESRCPAQVVDTFSPSALACQQEFAERITQRGKPLCEPEFDPSALRVRHG
jgi:hypothetical protein